MTLNPNDFYDVEINETNIDRYKMAERFGETREHLLNQAADAADKGYTISAKIPRDEVDGFNVFDVFESEHVDPKRIKSCGYELRELVEGGEVYVCILHGKMSRHNVEVNPEAPCIQVDPEVKPTKDQIDHALSCRYEPQHHPLEGTIQVCVIHGRQSKFDVENNPNMPCLFIEPRTAEEGDPDRP